MLSYLKNLFQWTNNPQNNESIHSSQKEFQFGVSQISILSPLLFWSLKSTTISKSRWYSVVVYRTCIEFLLHKIDSEVATLGYCIDSNGLILTEKMTQIINCNGLAASLMKPFTPSTLEPRCAIYTSWGYSSLFTLFL